MDVVAIWMKLRGTEKIQTEKHILLDRKNRMHGGFMTCMEMSMNGATICMRIIRAVQLQTRLVRLQARAAFCAGAVGSASRSTAVQRFGTTSIRRTGAATSASASPSSQWIENGACHVNQPHRGDRTQPGVSGQQDRAAPGTGLKNNKSPTGATE